MSEGDTGSSARPDQEVPHPAPTSANLGNSGLRAIAVALAVLVTAAIVVERSAAVLDRTDPASATSTDQ